MHVYKMGLIAGLIFCMASVALAIEEYHLDIGDTIRILVFEEVDMSFDIKIDETGVFAYPYMDEIQLAGKTTRQIETVLSEGLLGRVLIQPNIEVSVIEYRPFSIGGEVKQPGNYAFEPGLNVRKAINLAGGTTEWATGERFALDRKKSKNTTKKYTLDSPVYPGDTITVLQRRF